MEKYHAPFSFSLFLEGEKTEIFVIMLRLIVQILANEKHLNDVAEKILKENKDGQDRTEIMREFLVKNCKEMGLPPFKKDDEVVVLLYNEVFAGTMKGSSSSSSEKLEKDELLVVLKEILEKFAEQLEASPVFYDLVN